MPRPFGAARTGSRRHSITISTVDWAEIVRHLVVGAIALVALLTGSAQTLGAALASLLRSL